jgi:hypothetical protein
MCLSNLINIGTLMEQPTETVEQMIESRGANVAPRVTPQLVKDVIVAEYTGRASDLFSNAPAHPSLECLTIHVCVLRNGFTVVGTSACASPANYRADIGQRIARDNCVDQIQRLEGYLLKQSLWAGEEFAKALGQPSSELSGD